MSIRADQRLKQLPVIMIGAPNRPDFIMNAKKAGANNTIITPFNAATLKAKLVEVLGDF